MSARCAAAWRCFQCDEVFTDARAAAEHFTGSPSYPPACVRQLQGGERWAQAEIARLEAHAQQMYRQKTALERALQAVAGPAAVEAAYRDAPSISPLVSPPSEAASPLGGPTGVWRNNEDGDSSNASLRRALPGAHTNAEPAAEGEP